MAGATDPRAGILNFPCGVERLPSGNTLVVDAGDEQQRGSQILEIDECGRIVWQHQGDLKFPHSAVPLENGNLLVADTTNNRVIELARDHRIVFSSESWGDGTGRLSDGSHLDYPNDAHPLPEGNLIVTDRNNNRFVIVTRSGKVIYDYRTGIHHPHNVDPLPNGNAIIADSDHHRVIEVNPAGEIVWSYGDDDEHEKLNWPRDADRLPNGNTLICDSKNSRVIEVTRDREIAWSYELEYFANFYDADRLENGNTLITDQQHQRVIEIDPWGNIVWAFRNYVYDREIDRKIRNGSFRSRDENGLPTGWVPFLRTAEGGGEVVWGEDGQGRNIVGLRFDRTGGYGLTQLVAVEPGRVYRIGCALRAEGLVEGASAFLQFAFRDEYGGLFEDVFSSPKGQLLTGTTDWVNDAVEAEVPDRATTVEIRILITGPGTVWVRQVLMVRM